MRTRKEEALYVAEELLSDIELNRLSPIDITRKASRLARLLDDAEAMQWLIYEVSGYPQGVVLLDPPAWRAAQRSNRTYVKDSKTLANSSGIGQLQAHVESAKMQLGVTGNNAYQQNMLRKDIFEKQGLLDRIVGALHVFAADKYQELRFGDAVETAFETIRARVDADIANLIPDALPILTTALENASGDNKVQWNNAAKASRDLIKAAADALRPPSKQKNGISMTDANYVNRLVDWIQVNKESSTAIQIVVSDLEDLGKRLDAVNAGGNKGAHANVTKQQASRFVVGAYVLLGDILALQDSVSQTQDKEAPADISELERVPSPTPIA